MNKILSKFLFFSAAIAITFTYLAPFAQADVWVNGYSRSDGTYVQGHYRSSPDGNPYNNWSYPGNTNPYTGKVAPGNPSTYLKNYYGSGSAGGSGSTLYNDNSSNNSNGLSTSGGFSTYGSVEGGYYYGDYLLCSSGYYKQGNVCIEAPAHSTAYGGTAFYCDSGYKQTGDQCEKPENGYYIGYSLFCDSGYKKSPDASSCVTESQYCIQMYGLNTTVKNGTCYCSSGYQYDATSRSCVYVSINQQCIASYGEGSVSASTTTCTCKTGYEWNESMTQCVVKPVAHIIWIHNYVQILAKYLPDTPCNAMGLIDSADVAMCELYRAHENDYVWQVF